MVKEKKTHTKKEEIRYVRDTQRRGISFQAHNMFCRLLCTVYIFKKHLHEIHKKRLSQ